MVAKWPGNIKPAYSQRNHRRREDFMPTLLAAAGAPE